MCSILGDVWLRLGSDDTPYENLLGLLIDLPPAWVSFVDQAWQAMLAQLGVAAGHATFADLVAAAEGCEALFEAAGFEPPPRTRPADFF